MDQDTSIAPMLAITADDEPIVLDKPTVDITVDGRPWTGPGELRLELVPHPEVFLYFSLTESDLHLSSGKTSTFPSGADLKVNGYACPAFLALIAPSSDRPMIFETKWCPKSQPINGMGKTTTQMARLLFHIFSLEATTMPMFLRTKHFQSDDYEHIEINDPLWSVRISTLRSQDNQSGYPYSAGRYRLTHVVEVRKEDYSTFSGQEAETVLDACRFMLSFSKGNNCVPVCPVGLNQSGTPVWSQWSSPHEWELHAANWCADCEPDALISLFPGFMRMWGMENWRDALKDVIWWYVNANHSYQSKDVGIVFSQTAIERLSYEYCVEERVLVREQGFRALPAADQYRLLLSSLSIPLDIPNGAIHLQAAASGRNWKDAPQALTEIRNKLVHGGARKANLSEDCYRDAHSLAMWFLEMVLLRLFRYDGVHWNRSDRRREPVPWHTSAPGASGGLIS